MIGENKVNEKYVLIREARLGDEVNLAKIHVDTWRSTYQGLIAQETLDKMNYDSRIIRWKNLIEDGTELIIVAEDDEGSVVGYAMGGINRVKESLYSGELYAIYILKAFQRRGIGKKLIKAMAQKLDELGISSMIVWVLKGNPAYQFYASLGGQEVGCQDIAIDGNVYQEISFGWRTLQDLL